MSKISEIGAASNVAATDLILVTGNVGAVETSYSVEWKDANPYYQQIVSVAKDGGDYNSIQGAIDSIQDAGSAKPYAILIYPGTYTENVTLGASISLVGVGGVGTTTIYATSGDVLTVGTGGGFPVSAIENLNIKLTCSGNGDRAMVMSGGVLNLNSVVFDVDISNGYTDMIYLDGGTSIFHQCAFQFDQAGTGGGYQNCIRVTSTATYNIYGGFVDMDLTAVGASDYGLFIYDNGTSTSQKLVLGIIADMIASSTSFGGHMEFYKNVGTSDDCNMQGSHIHLSTPSGVAGSLGAVFDLNNGSAEMHSTGNRCIVTGFDENFFSEIKSGDHIDSHFDDIVAVDGSSIQQTGNLEMASSTFDGHISMTNVSIQAYDSVGGLDANQVAPGAAIPWNRITVKDVMYTHSPTVNNSRITVERTGLYRCTYQCTWSAGANNVDVQTYMYVNGTTETELGRSSTGQARSGTEGTNATSFLVDLSASDYVELFAERGGSTTTASNTVGNRSWIILELIRGNTGYSTGESSSSSSSGA